MVSMADPQIIQCASDCTVTVVHEFSLPVLQLSAQQGAQIAIAIVAVWVVGWALRQVIRLIRDSSNDGNKLEY